tara:strand:+ start:4767 stop:5003 length:237 start_codon:yes stop_codon:yes gene_type:complete
VKLLFDYADIIAVKSTVDDIHVHQSLTIVYDSTISVPDILVILHSHKLYGQLFPRYATRHWFVVIVDVELSPTPWAKA